MWKNTNTIKSTIFSFDLFALSSGAMIYRAQLLPNFNYTIMVNIISIQQLRNFYNITTDYMKITYDNNNIIWGITKIIQIINFTDKQ